ncbi:MAG: ATP-binding domain-containing protein, partial [Polyangiaceae bacterium]|nr:ATP-binding domain-containing protein [Polyangiaceae bacterium]
LVAELVAERIPQKFSFQPESEIQVLTPMHKGEVGTVALNQRLQARLNPDLKETVRPSKPAPDEGERMRFRVGDKVLQTKNDYEKGVFNGDVGKVVRLDSESAGLVVEFEHESGLRQVEYKKSEVLQLTLAYAMTIHKSQGSEYPAVVLALLPAHFVMLSRNLIYTAVTRAKKLCVVVGDGRAFDLALAETRKEQRCTWLAQRIRRACAS